MVKKYQKHMKTNFETNIAQKIEQFLHFFGNIQIMQKSIQKSKTPGLHFTSIQQLHHDFNTTNVQISSAAVERRRDDFKETSVDPPKTILTNSPNSPFLISVIFDFRSKIYIFFIILLIFSSIMNQIVISLFVFPDWGFLS